MTAIRKIQICISDTLLSQLDAVVAEEHRRRSSIVREAIRLYLRERRAPEIRQGLENGYREMAGVNRNMAEAAAEADWVAWEAYERYLLAQPATPTAGGAPPQQAAPAAEQDATGHGRKRSEGRRAGR
ncbi:MAG: hypothetical protein IMW99_06540 [Firmicutes bacterium]|nr:hypothetical protein [Bacillota bacterium]